jgi:hypothetical protein
MLALSCSGELADRLERYCLEIAAGTESRPRTAHEPR